MLDAFDDGLDYALAVVGAPDQIQGIQRDDDSLQCLLNVTISGELPDFSSEIQMTLKKLFESVGVDCKFGFLDELIQVCDVFFVRALHREVEGKRFQLNSELEYLLCVFKSECRNNSAGEGRSLNKSVMFQFDKCLANEALSDAELLGQLRLDDLFSTFDCPRQDGAAQESQDACFLGYRFDSLKCGTHDRRDFTPGNPANARL